MPHKGRPYPYHPDYWSTEAWFWPGYVPWKLKGLRVDAKDDPWDFCIFPNPQISEAGIPSTDRKVMSYTFNIGTGCLVTMIVVEMDLQGGHPGGLARWTVTAIYWDATSDTEVKTQEFPQRVVDSPVFEFEVPDPGCEPFDLVFVKFQPASYEEGGTPWERVPSGPP